jgi:membrane protease YdiL (CAAX protease family)
MNVVLDGPNINLVYYVISFVFVLIFLFRYLKTSFSDLLDNPLGALRSVILAYLMNYVFVTLISLVLMFLAGDALNPNTEEIINQTKLDTNVMVFIAVLLVPIVEETLFRGVLFGTLRGKSRPLAYIVTAAVFAVYHLWQYFFTGFDATVLFYLLQYLPASVALCWCYENSGTIWSPIVLHAAINLISINITIG